MTIKDLNEAANEIVKSILKDYRHVDDIKKAIDNLKQIQYDAGSKDEYGLGMYNGMELIKSMLLKQSPEYLSMKEWKIK